jgi:hypothetical protein
MARIAALAKEEQVNQAHGLPSILKNESSKPDVTATAQKRTKTANIVSIEFVTNLLTVRNKSNNTIEILTKLKNIRYPQLSFFDLSNLYKGNTRHVFKDLILTKQAENLLRLKRYMIALSNLST